ncbi:hypothetical protein BZL30_3547 [Mycobacterium kansasii]|uniref:DUF4185 domain-containing protein n=1 Tax=Mycobacterium kansasii TaxID=1768 RepID=A0A1V3X1Y2_MYCKA|nr:hypothetical protein BZL29_5163 [Mycobacterium kansasii]OOK75991.1 hypothetical protein BZL30_3547 [Mycobacterium kansasii]
MLRIGPTAGTGTPTGDYGIGATDLCEFVEFPSQLLQVCGDSFAGQGVGLGGWYSPIALHVDTASVDDPAGVRYTGVTGVTKPLLADPTPPGDSQLPAGVVQINRQNYLLVATTKDLVPQTTRLVKAEPARGGWQTVPGSRRDASYQRWGRHRSAGTTTLFPRPTLPPGGCTSWPTASPAGYRWCCTGPRLKRSPTGPAGRAGPSGPEAAGTSRRPRCGPTRSAR